MLALTFTFPAGRYHATPWDRHVNEGAVAWPPEPWRILRALIATWHHKLKHDGRHSEGTLRALIESLSTELPEYTLPAACHSHTRHYMPQFAAGKTSLIFDAFTAVDREAPLGVAWPDVSLPDDQRALLDDLLAVMGYLGRAESWVEARVVDTALPPNCRPGDIALDTQTGELKGELVTLYAPRPATDYQALRDHFLVDKKAQKKLGPTLPASLLDALSVETADLRKLGWSQPPAARKVSYLRPVGALRPRPIIRHTEAPAVVAAHFVLDGKPLPRTEDTLRIGELMRAAIMSQCKRAFGENRVPWVFSGHDMPDGMRDRHAFYLPWDSNGDGRLDRILVYVPDGMDAGRQRALTRLDTLRTRDGGEWRLVLENIGTPAIATKLTDSSTVWESVTPYLHPWHVKKCFGIEEQLKRECRGRRLPEPVKLEMLNEVDVGRGRKRRSIHFQRFRNRRDLTQPDRLGSFWHLEFSEPVAGPLALGFASHYGMGLFQPTRSD